MVDSLRPRFHRFLLFVMTGLLLVGTPARSQDEAVPAPTQIQTDSSPVVSQETNGQVTGDPTNSGVAVSPPQATRAGSDNSVANQESVGLYPILVLAVGILSVLVLIIGFKVNAFIALISAAILVSAPCPAMRPTLSGAAFPVTW